MKLKTIILLTISIVCATACRQEKYESYDVTNAASDYPNAYTMGRDDLTKMLQQCMTESQVRDRLLEIRARQYSIEQRAGKGAAAAYEAGFKEALRQSGDTLYSTLYGAEAGG